MIFGILNVINVDVQYLLGDGKDFPNTNMPDIRPLLIQQGKISMASEGYNRSPLTHMTSRWLGLFTNDPQLYEQKINN